MPPKRSDRLGEQLIGKVPTVQFDLLVVVFYLGFGWARCAMVDSKVSLILKLKLFASIYLATNHAVDKKRSTKIYKPLLSSHTTYSLRVLHELNFQFQFTRVSVKLKPGFCHGNKTELD